MDLHTQLQFALGSVSEQELGYGQTPGVRVAAEPAETQ